MLVGTALITLLFVAAVVGWRALRDEPSGPSRDAQSWSRIVVVDRLSGDVTWLDRDGAAVGESEGSGRVGSVFATNGVVAVANSSALTVLADPDADEDGAEAENLVVELPDRDTIDPLALDDRTLLVVGSSGGGDIMIVDPVDRSVTDIGAVVAATMPSPPLMFVETLHTNLDGSLYAVADATNFQTIAIDVDRDEPVFLPDQPVAVGDGLVATSETVGLQADISLVALDRSTEANVPTEIPAGGLMIDDTLTSVSVGGRIFRIEPGSEEADERGSLALPSGESVRSAEPAARGDRIVVSGTTFQAVVDLDGNTLFSTVLSQPVEFVEPALTWACLPVGGTGLWATVVDLTTGEHLADLTGVEVVAAVDDGCTVLAERDGIAEVISPDGNVVVGSFDEVVLAPDGKSVVTVAGSTVELVTIDELELGEPIDISDAAGTNSLISFVPD